MLLLFLVVWTTLVTGVQSAAAGEQLRIEIPGARAALWFDLEQQRWWLEGECDGGGRPFLLLERRGELMTVEFEDELRLNLSRHPFRGEQRFSLEIEGQQGRLGLRSSQGLGEMDLAVVVERHEDRRACSGERDGRK